MATLVTIPTGVQNRRGSDGSGFAIGKQTAAGTALTRVNYESTAGTDAVGSRLYGRATDPLFLRRWRIRTDNTHDIGEYGCRCGVCRHWQRCRRQRGNRQHYDQQWYCYRNRHGEFRRTVSDYDHTACSIEPHQSLTWGASVTTVSNSVTNGMIPILFPVSNLDMNENANIEDSDLISAIGSATPPDIGQYSGQMNFTTGLLTEELPYLLDGIFNNPTSSTSGCSLPRCRWRHGDQSADVLLLWV